MHRTPHNPSKVSLRSNRQSSRDPFEKKKNWHLLFYATAPRIQHWRIWTQKLNKLSFKVVFNRPTKRKLQAHICRNPWRPLKVILFLLSVGVTVANIRDRCMLVCKKRGYIKCILLARFLLTYGPIFENLVHCKRFSKSGWLWFPGGQNAHLFSRSDAFRLTNQNNTESQCVNRPSEYHS